jgi:tetratricopeptide (TPR) repeat protein
MMRIAMLSLMLLISVRPAWSGSLEDCFVERGSDPERTIRGCTELTQMEKLPPQRLPLVYARRAGAYVAKNDLERAIADYTESIRLKEDANTYYRRGNVYRKLKEFDRAIADYDKSAALNPNSTVALSARASTYDEKGDKQRAAAEYATLLEIEPTNEAVWTIWKSTSYSICVGEKETPAAIRACTALLNVPQQHRDPPQKIADIYFRRGFRFDQSGAVKEAMADYTESIRLDPRNSRPYKMRSVLYWKSKQNSLAIADSSAAIEMNPRDADVYKMRGSLYYSESQFDRAIADYSKAFALKPQDATILVQRARAYERKGDRARAIEDYRRVLELNPANESARDELRRLAPR